MSPWRQVPRRGGRGPGRGGGRRAPSPPRPMANLAYRPHGLALLDAGADARDVLAPADRRGRRPRPPPGSASSTPGRRGDATRATACLDWAGGSGRRGRVGVRDPGQHPHRARGGRGDGAAPGGSRRRRTARPTGCWPRCSPATSRAATARGRQSAALLVVTTRRRLRRRQRRRCRPARRRPPGPGPRARPAARPPRPALRAPRPAACLPLEGDVADEVRRRLAAARPHGLRRHRGARGLGRHREPRGADGPGRIDPLVLDHLGEAARRDAA